MSFRNETTKDLEKALEKGANLIDVRERFEYEAGHIPTAKNFPLSTLQQTYSSLDKNQTYYIICRSGARSLRASEFLDQKGYKVINVLGGLLNWRKPLVR